MTRSAIAEQRVFESWLDYQQALIRAIAPLTEAQLALRPLAGRRSIGEIAEHIVFGRALHVHRTLGASADALQPFHAWGEQGAPPRTAGEIVAGLELTWTHIVACLMHGAASDEVETSGTPTPEQVIWGLLDHDLPHAGQLSMLLAASGLPGVWI